MSWNRLRGLLHSNRFTNQKQQIYSITATWIGDLGSIIGKLIFETAFRGGRQLSKGEVQEIINAQASPQDMLGDIDGVVIAKTPYYSNLLKSNNGLRVSQILKSYYIDDIGRIKATRFSKFAKIVGLKGWSPSSRTFVNENAWINSYAAQVATSAAQYVANATKDPDKKILGLVPVTAMGLVNFANEQQEVAKILLRRFLNTLKTYIDKEPRKYRH